MGPFFGLATNATSSVCAPDESSLGIAFGTILFVGIGCSYISQHIKVLSSKSTQGLSWMMLVVANLSNWCALLNVVLLSKVSCCVLDTTSSENCYELFLPILQIGMPSINLLPLFAFFLCFQTVHFDKVHSDHQSAAASGRLARMLHWMDQREKLFARLSFLVFLVVFVFGFSVTGAVLALVPNAGDVVLFAQVVGIISGVTNCIQWIPQIVATLRNGHVGSLSILMLALQVPGGLAVVIFNTVVTQVVLFVFCVLCFVFCVLCFVLCCVVLCCVSVCVFKLQLCGWFFFLKLCKKQSSITTWGPFALSALQQFLLLIICIVFAIRDWRRRKYQAVEIASTDETEKLIVN